MSSKSKDKIKAELIRIGITLLIVGICIGLEIALDRIYIHDENIFLLFILAVLVILIETKNIVYGAVASVILVFSFNFFLTDPRYTFMMDDLNYYISFVVFLIISLICGSLVIKIQRKAKEAKESQGRIEILYEFSRKTLNCHSEKELFEAMDDCLKANLSQSFFVCREITKEKLANQDDAEAIEYALNQNEIVGKGQNTYSSLPLTVFPLRSKANKFGALVIQCDNPLPAPTFDFVKSITNEMVVVLEREKITFERERSEEAREKEKFKSTLLRSLSHDLKTPLTSIQSGSLFLKENIQALSQKEQVELLEDIHRESEELYAFVNNLLNISKLDDQSSIAKEYESVDEILQNVKEYFRTVQTDRVVRFPEVDSSLFVYANAPLLVQVFVNLIDNALKYTKPGSEIDIACAVEGNRVFFEVSDNGGGIKPEKFNSLFKDIFAVSAKKDAYRSSGLGLGICKAIVNAHNGTITAENNDKGGATFRFNLPLKKEGDQ